MDANKLARTMHFIVVGASLIPAVAAADLMYDGLPAVEALEFFRLILSITAMFPTAMLTYALLYCVLRPFLIVEWDLYVDGGYVATVNATTKDGARGQAWARGVPFTACLAVKLHSPLQD
ncbi:hypothetical protein RMR16_026880 (plasmid) [Agrobacterium sp. rho-13.3]|uniref:hypothetical protein n=1 Tax=Agrobacterium sp. rho-13.3 TaxID=3072980 RepID=UPI002A100B19|nr:hypothetical protein [Agrobacterium sp. rho-13.3]MDX8311569.1 hypothetical protein [Agrobacterium sp. rho-13.3]